MQLDLQFYDALCATSLFTVNGIRADSRDFGDQWDDSPLDDSAEGCGDMRFVRRPASPEVLAKYSITTAEYELVAGQLEAGLSFGRCSWCA